MSCALPALPNLTTAAGAVLCAVLRYCSKAVKWGHIGPRFAFCGVLLSLAEWDAHNLRGFCTLQQKRNSLRIRAICRIRRLFSCMGAGQGAPFRAYVPSSGRVPLTVRPLLAWQLAPAPPECAGLVDDKESVFPVPARGGRSGKPPVVQGAMRNAGEGRDRAGVRSLCAALCAVQTLRRQASAGR